MEAGVSSRDELVETSFHLPSIVRTPDNRFVVSGVRMTSPSSLDYCRREQEVRSRRHVRVDRIAGSWTRFMTMLARIGIHSRWNPVSHLAPILSYIHRFGGLTLILETAKGM